VHIRDQVIDFVQYWAARAQVALCRLLKWLGIPSSKYYDWCKRYGKPNRHNARIPRDYWLLDWERQKILDYHREHPQAGYRRLSYMMLDTGIVAASPSSVYRVLRPACSRQAGGASGESCSEVVFQGERFCAAYSCPCALAY